MANSPLRSTFHKTFLVSGLLAALLAVPAFADDTADVTKLMRSRQYVAALTKADAFLEKNPRDAQMRFLKGVILTEQNRSTDAIAIFTKLTEDYPSLPEPYNNLAVLYAASGQYDKARVALEAAIRTNPSYATAYENLGDVHAKLASQAYDKALQLDSSNSTAKSKLTLVRSLVSNLTASSAQPTVAPPVIAQVPAPRAATPPALPPAVTVPAPRPLPVVPAIVKREPIKPEPKAERADGEEVLATVHGWARAWSEQNVSAYLNYYSSGFRTPHHMSRKTWEDERRARIVDKGRISVSIESPQVEVSGNTATVTFHQIYVSDRLKSNSRKTLVLEKHGAKWQIKQESSGS